MLLPGTTKKCGMLKIVHEKYKHNKKNTDQVLSEFVHSFDEALEHNKEIEGFITKTQVSQRFLTLILFGWLF